MIQTFESKTGFQYMYIGRLYDQGNLNTMMQKVDFEVLKPTNELPIRGKITIGKATLDRKDSVREIPQSFMTSDITMIKKFIVMLESMLLVMEDERRKELNQMRVGI